MVVPLTVLRCPAIVHQVQTSLCVVCSAIDPRGEDECRPTRSAWGYVLFGQLQFNNVFGTPIGLKPTLAYSAGAEGRAVAPAASWVEDQSRLGLSRWLGLSRQMAG